MRYLITTNCEPPFLTNWFEPENHFNAEVGMTVYDIRDYTYTTDGKSWKVIDIDHV